LGTFDKEFTLFSFAPQPIDIQNIRAYSGNRNLKEPLPLRRLEEDTLLLREPVRGATTANPCSRRFSTTQSGYIVFTWQRHDDVGD